ncbi:hypothetical protein GGI04_002319 [Coemansia thaxteri]|uniref:BolA-like protein n=1 Tax=Coemansia thaxteri TaxID=2663907 RepID=A0A9W8EI86_9FUNG|nr:hypothetical protein H4R26_004371 [Coemansia thaxteri]KAJ2005249.1 hypothetical protein GGI04_002319 [Coemansia thaxteri]KAJ2480042.1 hypothetical protein EV174_003840 [Coemansia sp. RSA 2320]
MISAEDIQLKLETALDDISALIQVVDKSASGCGQMFDVTIASDKFKGLLPLRRHRLVHDILKDELAVIHALSLFLYTKAQYDAKFPPVPATGNNQAQDEHGDIKAATAEEQVQDENDGPSGN